MPFELNMLPEVHEDFLAFGLSVVNIDADILRGRPYGCTAVLYRKKFSEAINVVANTEPCMCSVNITNIGHVLLSVYTCLIIMVTSGIEYTDICANISSAFSDSDALY